MSDLAAGIPIGMSIGIGAGIAIGKKAAQKEIAKKLNDLALDHDIKIKKPNGHYMAIDDLIEMLGALDRDTEQNKKQIVLVLVGLIILLAGIITFFML